MKTNWKELFEQDDTVFHCETEELAIKLLKIANDLGYKWNNGKSYLENISWKFCEEETCYWIKDGTYYFKDYFEKQNYTILNVKDLLYGRRPFKLHR